MSDRSLLSLQRCRDECLHPEAVIPLLGQVLDPAGADEVASTFGLLSDPTRARILHALSMTRELCVHDLALLLGMTQSALSHQLRLLRDARAVVRTRAGRTVFYRLADHHVRHLLGDALDHASEKAPRAEAPGP